MPSEFSMESHNTDDDAMRAMMEKILDPESLSLVTRITIHLANNDTVGVILGLEEDDEADFAFILRIAGPVPRPPHGRKPTVEDMNIDTDLIEHGDPGASLREQLKPLDFAVGTLIPWDIINWITVVPPYIPDDERSTPYLIHDCSDGASDHHTHRIAIDRVTNRPRNYEADIARKHDLSMGQAIYDLIGSIYLDAHTEAQAKKGDE